MQPHSTDVAFQEQALGRRDDRLRDPLRRAFGMASSQPSRIFIQRSLALNSAYDYIALCGAHRLARSTHMNAQDFITTSVVGLATDTRIRRACSHRNLSAIEPHPIASLTLAATIGPDRPLPLRRNRVSPSFDLWSAGAARKDAKSSIRHAMLAVICLVAVTSSAAFGDEMAAGVTVLRGTPARVEQAREPQRVQVIPPPLPSCPDGYAYSPFVGNCYRPRDPLNPVP